MAIGVVTGVVVLRSRLNVLRVVGVVVGMFGSEVVHIVVLIGRGRGPAQMSWSGEDCDTVWWIRMVIDG